MNIRTIKEGFKSPIIPLRFVFPEKEYAFVSTFENAKVCDKDFVFIPLGAFEHNILTTVKAALKNPHCKGFILNKSIIDKFELHEQFHIFMSDLDSDPEVLFLVRNIYNFANYLVERKTREYGFKTIAITGTDKTTVVKDILVNNLDASKTTHPLSQWTSWQKIYEPILMADYSTEYAIVEVQPAVPEITICASRLVNKHVIFTRSTVYKMDVYHDLTGLSDNLLTVLAEDKSVLSIFSPDYNELINDRVPYTFSDRAHFIKSDRTQEKKLKKEYTYVYEFLKYIGKDKDSAKAEFNTSFPLYKVFNFRNSEYFVVNNKRVLFENVKSTFKAFNLKYKDKKKVVIFEHITGLGMYKKTCVKELFKLFAEANPEVLVLLNTEAYNHLYKKNEQTTYLKNLPLKADSKESKVKLKRFIKGIVAEGSAVYVASPNNLSFLLGGEIL